ncbi:hypothetical protein [Mesorhizobium sp. L2C066B000]|uniref:hypothetical protein n=1 Tax=Mesorhizobium sp. L2C066B000 TaxID=1287105 RepID=UPI0003D038B0|nr:hypothetical protein [Mesorhizobium sp. L2C066B000]ESZ32712.1 hypothetical protein X732_27940 [Mesorhizobium sp. L2C066B000]
MARRKGSKNVKAPIAPKAKAAPAEIANDVVGVDASQQQPPVAPLDTAGTTQGDKAGAGTTETTDPVHGLRGPAIGADSGTGENVAAEVPAEAVNAALPRYRCHKVVQALKLTDITRNLDTGQVTLTPEDKSYQPFDAPPGWYERFHGSDNDTGYFVQYEDGFSSWSPTEPFEDGYSLMPAPAGADSLNEEDYERTWKFDVAGLARAIAGGARLFADGGMVTEYQDVFDLEEAAIMAEFVRDNPDAPLEAMFIHLGLKKRTPRTEPNRADLFVLSLFHAACKAAFKFEADQAAEAEAAKVKPEPSGRWPGERAMQPSDPVFAPTGFSPR